MLKIGSGPQYMVYKAAGIVPLDCELHEDRTCVPLVPHCFPSAGP